ncbi:hypothetical protein SLA2020_038990 [Shorea laevis]
MDVRNWCNSGSETIRLGGSDDDDHKNRSLNSPLCFKSIGQQRWKVLWMKFKKEKKKFFESPEASSPHVPYDAYTYSQNFDYGCARDEPENLSRSFSARFAVPSRVF